MTLSLRVLFILPLFDVLLESIIPSAFPIQFFKKTILGSFIQVKFVLCGQINTNKFVCYEHVAPVGRNIYDTIKIEVYCQCNQDFIVRFCFPVVLRSRKLHNSHCLILIIPNNVLCVLHCSLISRWKGRIFIKSVRIITECISDPDDTNKLSNCLKFNCVKK